MGMRQKARTENTVLAPEGEAGGLCLFKTALRKGYQRRTTTTRRGIL